MGVVFRSGWRLRAALSRRQGIGGDLLQFRASSGVLSEWIRWILFVAYGRRSWRFGAVEWRARFVSGAVLYRMSECIPL